MSTTTTTELVAYYANLLIMQYLGQPKAYAQVEATVSPAILPQTSVQTIAFPIEPIDGNFSVSYNGVTSSLIAYDASTLSVEATLRALPGLSEVVVTGGILPSDSMLTVTFIGVPPVAELLVVVDNTLLGADSVNCPINIESIDVTLPLAVLNGFNLTGPTADLAVGAQLDMIGKYAGVSRTGPGFSGVITLSDADFRSLIAMAIAVNSAGSSLYDIQVLLNQFFPGGQILVFDYQNMQMSYLIDSSVGSQELMQMFITQNLLPRPMAVGVALVIYAPIIDSFFGFGSYTIPAYNNTPFNTYEDYQTDWPWLSYTNAIEG